MSYFPDHWDAFEKGLGSMPSRYLCDVLGDMRKMHETRNYSGLMGSIEQAQVMAYRMEAALDDKKTIEEYDEQAAKLNRDLKKRRAELSDLSSKIDIQREEKDRLEGELKTLRHELKKESKGGTLDPKKKD